MKSVKSKLLVETWRKFLNESEYDIDTEEFPGEMDYQDSSSEIENLSDEMDYQEPPPAGLDRHLDEKSNEETMLRVADGLGAEYAILDRQNGKYMITLCKDGEYDAHGEPERIMVRPPIPYTSITIVNGEVTEINP